MTNSQRADKLIFLEYNLKVYSKNRTFFYAQLLMRSKQKLPSSARKNDQFLFAFFCDGYRLFPFQQIES